MRRDGETVDEYISRLEERVKELEPPEGFTFLEWYVGQVHHRLLYKFVDLKQSKADEAAILKWNDNFASFSKLFPEEVEKFEKYMGWQ